MTPTPMEPELRDHGIKRNIPGHGLDAIDPLAGVRDTDQQGPTPKRTPSQVGQGAIIKAPAHADAATAIIETDQWQEQQIDVPRG